MNVYQLTPERFGERQALRILDLAVKVRQRVNKLKVSKRNGGFPEFCTFHSAIFIFQ
jgi:hypothetical protein